MRGGRTIRTPRKRAIFLAALAEHGNIHTAVEMAAIGRTSVYEWRDDDPTFARDWDMALETYTDTLEAVADRRAKAGSDVLLIFRLKALRPDKYRERQDLAHTFLGPLQIEMVDYGIDPPAV